jgi:hypothetical protein
MANRNADVDNPERLEAQARVIMWELSRIPKPDEYDPRVPRNDRRKAREALLAEFDAVVDRRAVSLLMQALETA